MTRILVVLAVLFVLLTGCNVGVQAPPTKVQIVTSMGDIDVPQIPGASPVGARAYRAVLIRETRVIWGMDGPVALFAAQVEQESGWNVGARSPVGAQGLGQFMPGTAKDMGDLGLGGGVQPLNPDWSLRALTHYNKQLYDHALAATDCDRHAFMLVGYNGGEGWRMRDQKLAVQQGYDGQRYFGNVEKVNAGRTASAWAENRSYVPAILKRQSHYVDWGKGTCI